MRRWLWSGPSGGRFRCVAAVWSASLEGPVAVDLVAEEGVAGLGLAVKAAVQGVEAVDPKEAEPVDPKEVEAVVP